VILPSLLNVGALLLLFLYIYAIVGNNMFATVKFDDSIFENENFQNIWNAALTLFIMSTGENFDGIMDNIGRRNSLLF
jgi:hypothetical protein